jgi:uncharacterized membrane protein YqiK
MKTLAVVLVVTFVWLVLASVRDGRGEGAMVDATDAWMLEQHERVVRLGREAVIPAGHPLSRLDLGDRPQEVRS